uniref:Zinc finger protein 574-like n=1 Tax=Sinocyclocheilus grahami TaxID=75366 RepID=A0A672JZC5_SINGR
MWEEEERKKVNLGLLLLRKSQSSLALFVKKDSPHRFICCVIAERLIRPKGALNATSAGNRSRSRSICETTCAHTRASVRSSAACVERPFPLLQIFPAMDLHTRESIRTGVTYATKPSANRQIYANTVSIFTATQRPHPVQTALLLLSLSHGLGPGRPRGSSSATGKSHPCPVCGKLFGSASSVTLHQRVHTGERPYPCAICGKRFRQNTHLREHLRTHSGERPFRCEFCDKGFVQSMHLAEHRRTHTASEMDLTSNLTQVGSCYFYVFELGEKTIPSASKRCSLDSPKSFKYRHPT